MIYINEQRNNNNELIYGFNYINPQEIINSLIHDSLFKLYYSLYIIDYMKDILNLVEKLVSKIKIILFDKYIDNNNLTFKIDETNEKKFEEDLKRDLKNNIFFGELSLRLSNMYKNEIFEEGILNKLDDKIHFNLKNIENIIIGNLRPALNRIEVYIKENNFRENDIKLEKDKYFISVFSSVETFLNDLVEISSEYRNFMAWLYSLYSQYISNEIKTNNNPPQKKNNLDKIYIKNDYLLNFIQEEKYNLKYITTFFNEKNNEVNSYKENKNNLNYSSSNDSTKNIFAQDFMKKNNFNFNSFINIHESNDLNIIKDNNNENFIMAKLDFLKSLIKEEISSKYLNLSNEVQKLSENFLSIIGLDSEISKFEFTCNESNEYIFYFISQENEKQILNIIAINMNYQCKFSKINFSYEMNIKIIDYKITSKNELLLLVKAPLTNNSNEKSDKFKFTIISSDLSNYVFLDIKNVNLGEKLVINFSNYSGCEDIKIDELADVDCSDNSFLALTGKGFITLVDNSLNKITIIDLIQDK